MSEDVCCNTMKAILQSKCFGPEHNMLVLYMHFNVLRYDLLKHCIKQYLNGERCVSDNLHDVANEIVHSNSRFTTTENQEEMQITEDLAFREEKSILEEMQPPNEDNENERNLKELYALFTYIERCGEGISEDERVKIFLSCKKLSRNMQLEHIRFWGKIFGRITNYYIIETDPQEEEEDSKEAEETMQHDDGLEKQKEENGTEPPLPKSRWKPPPKAPMEDLGEGSNAKTFFVSNNACGPWIRLPDCKPEHIVISRKICQYFSGNLNAPVNSFLPFHGTEADYLRAQIARISSATHIAPEGFYNRLGEGEDDDDLGWQYRIEENETYTERPVSELTLDNWVHSAPYILPQGRATWWDPRNADGEGREEEDDDESSVGDVVPKLIGLGDDVREERGPPILTPIQHDISLNGQSSPWILRYFPHGNCVRVSSQLWVGAHAVAWPGGFGNLYIGWGMKNFGVGYNPPIGGPLPAQYAGNDIVEAVDPTPEEEALFQKAIGEMEADDDDEGEDDDGEAE